jgi:hypothetical protein
MNIKETQAVSYLKSRGYDASLMPVDPPSEEKLGVYISSWDEDLSDKSEFRLHDEEVESLSRMYKRKKK